MNESTSNTRYLNQNTTDSAKGLQDYLNSYFEKADQSERFSELLRKSDRYKQAVSSPLLKKVQEEYRQKKDEIEKLLDQEKENLKTILFKHTEENNKLEKECSRLKERLKEIQFRQIVGEYTREEIEEERTKLRTALLENSKNIALIEDSLNLLVSLELPLPEKFKIDEIEQPKDLSYTHIPSFEHPKLPDIPKQSNVEIETQMVEKNYLIFLDGTSKGKRFPLLLGDLTMGSGPGNDIQLNDEGINRIHATIRYADQKYIFDNCDKLNRSYVNGVQSKTVELKNDDVIRLGEITLKIKLS